MSNYYSTKSSLQLFPKTWLITGVSGFIGSNLLEVLLLLNQKVVGLDNFFSGAERNLSDVQSNVGEELWKNFTFINGSICNLEDCLLASEFVDYILHHAAIGSVPLSITDPLLVNEVNVQGFINILFAAKRSGVKRVIYATSSAVYGDDLSPLKTEHLVGSQLSPYAVTKLVNELYAGVFTKSYGIETIGLRYFNIFGPRQDPNGSYAAVIPKWIQAFLKDDDVIINGDGSTTRDFCYVDNVIQANILAACSTNFVSVNQIYNIGSGRKISLNQLFHVINKNISIISNKEWSKKVLFTNFRYGDILHSQADISKANSLLSYKPSISLDDGLTKSINWYLANKL